MSDLELMELAAKAAGIAVHRGSAWQSDMLFREIPRPSSPLVANVEWSPLTDDGDALRLAVKLRLVVRIQEKCVYVETEPESLLAFPSVSSLEMVGKDPLAATRRAIVRAAAEIGRQIGGNDAE